LQGIADTETFHFSSPIAGIGGLINWCRGCSGDLSAYISIFDANDILLETLPLLDASIDEYTPGTNLQTPGGFFGFERTSNDIASFSLTGKGVGIWDMQAEALPEPVTITLFGAGLAGTIAFRRKRRKKTN
jgi:hypothetical protein